MDLSPLLALLAGSQYAGLVPYVLVAFFGSSVIQTFVKPPAPGSHWLPVYAILSLLSANFGYAKNSNVPALSTWVGRILSPLAPALLAAVEAQKAANPEKASSPVAIQAGLVGFVNPPASPPVV